MSEDETCRVSGKKRISMGVLCVWAFCNAATSCYCEYCDCCGIKMEHLVVFGGFLHGVNFMLHHWRHDEIKSC